LIIKLPESNTDPLHTTHLMALAPLVPMFEYFFVHNRTWVILLCACIRFLHGHIGAPAPVATPLQDLNGAQLLNPLVIEPLTRASVSSREKAGSINGHSRARCLIRFAKDMFRFSLDMVKDDGSETQSSSIFANETMNKEINKLDIDKHGYKRVLLIRKEMNTHNSTFPINVFLAVLTSFAAARLIFTKCRCNGGKFVTLLGETLW